MSLIKDFFCFVIVMAVLVAMLYVFLVGLDASHIDPLVREAVIIAASAVVGSVIYDYFKKVTHLFEDEIPS